MSNRLLRIGWIALLLLARAVASPVEFDVSWDFGDEDGRSGWGNSTVEDMNMEVKAQGGELRCSIIGQSPFIESPRLFLNVTRRHVVVIRAKYLGSATEGRLMLRSGGAQSADEQLLSGKAYWADKHRVVPISGLDGGAAATDLALLADGLQESYYLSAASEGVSVVLDLGAHRWVSALRLQPIGDSRSPQRCVLQQSVSQGVGPFKTVRSFRVLNGTEEFAGVQRFAGFSGHARYWRLLLLDNHGGSGIGVREVYLDGYDEKVTVVPFALRSDNVYHTYYLPISSYLTGMLLRMRIELLYVASEASKRGKLFREDLSVDHIRIARAPEVWKVRGCLDKYFSSPNYEDPVYNLTSQVNRINNNLPIRYFRKENMSLQYATTYDCPPAGGAVILIEGINLGLHPTVHVGERSCVVTDVRVRTPEGRVQQISCTLPPGTGAQGPQRVRVSNGLHPGLLHDVPSLSYRCAPPVPDRPAVTNIGARRVDLVWSPPASELDHLAVTGYKVLWFQPAFRTRVSNMTVGNVTTTSVRGLEPGTEYVFAIAAVSEGASWANAPTDLYGRRDFSPSVSVGEFSGFTNATGTLPFDFDFSLFSANATLNHTGTTANSLGPTGQYGAEGSYGLVLVGSANVQNCNVSSTCCDGYNATLGVSSCGSTRSLCAVLPARQLAYDLVLGGVSRRGVASNLDYANGLPGAISILTLEELIANKGADLPSSACGPALRLTPSTARHSGAAWYRRKLNVREGFDTYVKFQISNPSQKCTNLDDVNTYCRSRGADGFAFVIQNVAPDALGNAGSGLGYEGIFNSLAVEVDTFHNFDQMDYYENHISILTEGFRFNITANHSRALATTNRIPDMTDGVHTLRIKYDPNFDVGEVPHPSFQVSGFSTWFLNNADFPNGGEGDWGVGFGLLQVYLDDMYSPVITTPINLASTLALDDGRSYVGLTAATGDEYWQAHDILRCLSFI
mmetsp:Transcript_14047/g.30832  ORF Transcript_14047/g.30832 Transcript_14047/m.30832 type:complete len:963 (-) Transcript_14047:82-2970(-)